MRNLLLLGAAGVGGYLAWQALKPRYDFGNRTVLITGGSRGLGLVLARQLADAGARLGLMARDQDELDRAAYELRSRGARVSTTAGDLKARDDIHAQVQESVRKGARLLLGGEVPDRPGAWYPATVLSDARPGMPAYDEEVFGPVAAIIEAADETEAILIANGSPFGLGSGVLTEDLVRGERIAAEDLEAGLSFVNGNVRSDPRMPFGGVKDSGYGRECSYFGIREFTNIKSVVVES